MCHMWKVKESGGCLDKQLLKELAGQLKEVLSGEKEVVFSGGEPLLYAGITEVISQFKQAGLKVGMASNGVLINKKIAQDLSRSGLSNIQLSLDSVYPDTHDFLRGVVGSHEKVLMAAEYLSSYKETLSVCAQTVISGKNITELIETVEFVKNSGIFSHISFMAVTTPFFTALDENWQTHQEFAFLWPRDLKNVNFVIDRIIDMKKNGYPIANPVSHFELFRQYFNNPKLRNPVSVCHLGDNVVSIDPLGDVRMCCSLSPLGNINTARISDMLSTKEIEVSRNKMKACHKTCNALINCFFKETDTVG